MKKAVLLIHGFLSDTGDFGVLAEKLKTHYESVKLCKIPGHDGVVDFKLFKKEDTVLAVLDAFDELKSKYKKVDVVGFSMGGALATMLCSLRDVHKVVLIAPSNRHFNFNAFFNITNYVFKEFGKSYRECKGNADKRWKHARKCMMPFNENSKISLDFAFHKILPNLSFHTYSVFKDLMKYCNECVERQGKIDVPSFVMWGKLDELVPPTSVEFVKKHFSKLKVKIYDGIGHAMILTNRAEALSEDILGFLIKKPKKKLTTDKQ